MKQLLITGLLLLAFVAAPLRAGDNAGAPKWKVELKEKPESYDFLQKGKYLFFTSGEHVWLYDAASGEKVWYRKIDDYEKKGVHELVGERYYVSTGDYVLCIDAISGKDVWKQKYNKISQDDFSHLMSIGDNIVFRYGENHIGVDMATGAETWRTKIDYNGELVTKGSYNWMEYSGAGKFIVMLDGDKAGVFDIHNGQKVFTYEKCEINQDLIEHGHEWSMRLDDEKYCLMVLDKGAVVLDMVNNKEFLRKEFKINGDYNVLLPTGQGCAVMGDKEIVHFNVKNGTTVSLPFPIGDIRTMHQYSLNGKDVLIVGMDSKMAGVDLVEGKVLWESKKDDPQFEGYAHRFMTSDDAEITDGDNVAFTYNNPNIGGKDKGTSLYLMSVNALTGAVNYKTKVAHGAFAMTSFTRGLAKTLTGAMTGFMTVASAGMAAPGASKAFDMVSDMMGWSNIGFDYEMFEYNGNITVALRTPAKMLNPDTHDDGGEGFCAVNPKTGTIAYKDYFEICDDGQQSLQLKALPSYPTFAGSVAYIPGKDRIVAFDLAAGKRLWTVEKKKLDDALPIDLAVIDGTLFVKFGKLDYTTKLDKDKIKTEESFKRKPYGFMAVDIANGDILWRIDTKVDPGFVTPRFVIRNYYNPSTHQLYFADEENLYALRLTRDGGKFDWTYNFDKNKVGEMKFDKTYAINESWLGADRKESRTDYYFNGSYEYSVSIKTGGANEKGISEFIDDADDADLVSTYESWGNHYGVSAKKCLRVMYNGTKIIAIGTDGIGSVDAATGKGDWVAKWDYDQGSVQYIPRILQDKIVYCVDRKIACIDMANGRETWHAKEAKKPRFFNSPDDSYLFSIDDEDVAGYQVK